MTDYNPNRYDIIYTKVTKETIPGNIRTSEWVSIFDFFSDKCIYTLGDLNLTNGYTEVFEGVLCTKNEVVEIRPANETEKMKLFKKIARDHKLRYDFDKHKYIKIKQEED